MHKESNVNVLFDLSDIRQCYDELVKAVRALEPHIEGLDLVVSSVPLSDNHGMVVAMRRSFIRDVVLCRTDINRVSRNLSRAVSELEDWAKS